jgi:flavin-dependent dehydrogenase
MADFEFGIIGGGPAGTTAAIYLSRLGYSVCLFEKKIFPRDTLCGEFLSVEVTNILQELELFEQFLTLKPNHITRFRFINNDSKEITVPLNFKSFGLRRSVFDHFLLTQAKVSGAVIFQPAEIRNIYRIADSFVLSIKTNPCTFKDGITVSKLIAAWGRQSKLDKLIGRNFINYKSGMNGVKIHIDKNQINGFHPNEIKIYAADKIYCGVNVVDNGMAALCFLEETKRANIPSKQQFGRLMKFNKNFRLLFPAGFENEFVNKPVTGTGNIFFGRRNLIENGIYMIGDSAGVITPLAGDGIGMAMESARLLASLFQYQMEMKLTEEAVQRMYVKKWNDLFKRRIRTAWKVQKIIMNPVLRKTGVYLGSIYPEVVKRIISRTRNVSLIQY